VIRDRFGLEPELIASGGGVFEIRADEDLIFSKRQLGRFPEDGEIVDLLAGLQPD
jgi:selenoprotein W-related protein